MRFLHPRKLQKPSARNLSSSSLYYLVMSETKRFTLCPHCNKRIKVRVPLDVPFEKSVDGTLTLRPEDLPPQKCFHCGEFFQMEIVRMTGVAYFPKKATIN